MAMFESFAIGTCIFFRIIESEFVMIHEVNPPVIEKANVDAELERLTRLRSQHAEATYRIRSKIRNLADDIPR